MEIERQYLAALDLTHQMLSAAIREDWDTLTRIGSQRVAIITQTQASAKMASSLDPALARRIAGIITEIERESGEIVEHVQAWQKHASILLRLDKAPII
jgi:hypothetical protein